MAFKAKVSELVRAAHDTDFVTYDDGTPVSFLHITASAEGQYGPSGVVHLWGDDVDGTVVNQGSSITVRDVEVEVSDDGICFVDIVGPDGLVDVPDGTAYGLSFTMTRPITESDLTDEEED